MVHRWRRIPVALAFLRCMTHRMPQKISFLKWQEERESTSINTENDTLKPFHPKSAEWVGYVLRTDGNRIYIAGDTDATKEAKAVKCEIALVPIGGTYTMDVKKAAELVNTIRPNVAIPVHYGSIVGKSSDGDVFAQNVKDPIMVEFKIMF